MEAVEIIIAIGGVATALTAIWAIVYGITKWVHKQNTQSTDIEALEKKHDADTKMLREEEQAAKSLLYAAPVLSFCHTRANILFQMARLCFTLTMASPQYRAWNTERGKSYFPEFLLGIRHTTAKTPR